MTRSSAARSWWPSKLLGGVAVIVAVVGIPVVALGAGKTVEEEEAEG